MIFLLLGGRWLLALVFLVAGFSKVRDREHRAEVVGRYGILPGWSVPFVAAALPWFEVSVGLALALGVQPAVAGLLAVALLTAFSVAVAWNLFKGRRFDCGCGIDDRPIGWQLVIRNMLLALIAGVIGGGPAAGLALWSGWAARTWLVPATWELVPVPLTVVAVIGAVRCVQAGWATLARHGS